MGRVEVDGRTLDCRRSDPRGTIAFGGIAGFALALLVTVTTNRYRDNQVFSG